MVYSSFNPCFIGTYSITNLWYGYVLGYVLSFNPCFIGTYSITDTTYNIIVMPNAKF